MNFQEGTYANYACEVHDYMQFEEVLWAYDAHIRYGYRIQCASDTMIRQFLKNIGYDMFNSLRYVYKNA